MADQQQDNQLQFLLSDLGTRLRDLEERTNSLKERLLLINNNLIEIKETVEQRVSQIEKQNSSLALETKKLNSSIQSLLSEMNSFVRKDEIILVERMLKDFQPLDFIRRKDLEELKQTKQITETYYEPQLDDTKIKSKGIKTKETNI